MKLLYIITTVLVLLSLFSDRAKTIKGIKTGLKKFVKVLPVFVIMMILVALLQGFISDDLIAQYLGKSSGIAGMITALVLGSVTLMPGFIVFPLSGVLLSKGAFYMIIAMFTNATMLVGVLTFPVEKRYLGLKVSVIRNVIALIISLITGLIIGWLYGEL